MSRWVRFAFRLALKLGQPDPYLMLRRMPVRTFLHWSRFYRFEPFGSKADWFHTASIICAVAQMVGGSDCDIGDFMPDFKRTKDDATPTLPGSTRKTDAEMAAIILGAVAEKRAFGGAV